MKRPPIEPAGPFTSERNEPFWNLDIVWKPRMALPAVFRDWRRGSLGYC